jgi:hypothetical protein
LENNLQNQKNETENLVKNITSEVLWRIRDAEELIKSRVSETRV